MVNPKSNITGENALYFVNITKVDKSSGHEVEILEVMIPLTYCRLVYVMLRNYLKLSNMEKD